MNTRSTQINRDATVNADDYTDSLLMHYFDRFKQCIYSIFLRKSILIFITWVLVHFISAHIYIYMCVPATLYGILMSPFMVDVPYCYASRWIMMKSVNSINLLWISLGSWCIDRVHIGVPLT